MKGESVYMSRHKALLIIIAASVAAYAGTLWNGFVMDDALQIERNWWIRDFDNLFAPFSSNVWGFLEKARWVSYYRPMVHLLYMAIYKFSGVSPWGYHLAGVLLNAGAAAAVFLVISVLLREQKAGGVDNDVVPAFAGALFFSLHPMHTEAVSFASAVAEPLFTLFGLFSFYFYAASERRGIRRFASVFFFALALLSKETAVVFFPMILAYDFIFKKNGGLKKYAPYAAVILIYVLLRRHALEGVAFAPDKAGLAWHETLVNAVFLFASYMIKLAVPAAHNIYHMLPSVVSPLEWRGAAVLVFAAVYALAAYLSGGMLRFALVWAVLALLPALYVPALGVSAFAERYLYLPSAGLAMAVAFFAVRAFAAEPPARLRSALMAVFAVLMALFFASIILRSFAWKNDFSLWADSARKTPQSHIAHDEVGLALYAAGRLDEAEAEFKEAIRLNPGFGNAHNNLGLVYRSKGNFAGAAEEYETAARLMPGLSDARNNLGLLYASAGETERALEEYLKALSIQPDNASVRNNLGVLYAKTGRNADAIRELSTAVRLRPGYADAHYNLGAMYEAAGDKERAMAEFNEAKRIEGAAARP